MSKKLLKVLTLLCFVFRAKDLQMMVWDKKDNGG